MSVRYAGLGGSASQGFYFEIEGLEEVQNRIDLLADYLARDASVPMMEEVGHHVSEWMRQNVLSNFVQRTGALYNSIDYAVLSNDAGDVSLFAGPNDQTLPYTAIHEFGGTIYPIPPNTLLKFQIDGEWKAVRKVNMPARPYIRPAFTEHETEIVGIMEDYLYDAIASGAASI